MASHKGKLSHVTKAQQNDKLWQALHPTKLDPGEKIDENGDPVVNNDQDQQDQADEETEKAIAEFNSIYKTHADIQAAKKALYEDHLAEWDSWDNSLSHAQQVHFKNYMGSGYALINDHLRNGGKSKPADQAIKKALDSYVTHENIAVYRGVTASAIPKFAQADPTVLVGASYTDKGFMSASANEGAKHFASERPYEFVIGVPAGTGRGAYVGPKGLHSENEYLINKGSTIKIRAVKKVYGRWRIYADLEV